MTDLAEEIRTLKESRGAVILAHKPEILIPFFVIGKYGARTVGRSVVYADYLKLAQRLPHKIVQTGSMNRVRNIFLFSLIRKHRQIIPQRSGKKHIPLRYISNHSH